MSALVGYDDWDELVDELASDLAPALRRLVYKDYLERLRKLEANTEKLVYLYLVLAQPQSYSTLRRGLRLPERTLSKSLNKLKKLKFVERDEEFLYWLTEPDS